MIKIAKKRQLNKKTRMIIISVSVALIIAMVPITYAIFTGSAFTQRTIGAYDAYGDNFTSNYLKRGNAYDNVFIAYANDSSKEATAYVTVCNYPQGNQTRYSKINIDYYLYAELVYFDETKQADDKYSVADNSYLASLPGCTVQIGDVKLGNGFSNSARIPSEGNITLQGKKASTNTYNIVFDISFNAETPPNLYLRLTATPQINTLPTITGIVKPAIKPQEASNKWTGTFRDDTANQVDDYDGFNYIISGVGSGSFTLTWNSAKVGLSHVSQKMLMSIDGASISGDSITFDVDSDVESRYEIQFYKVNTSGASWFTDTEEHLVYILDGENKVVDFVFE